MATLFRIFVKAAAILMLFAAASVAQTRDKSTGQDSSDIKVLEERVKNIDEEMADNKAEIKDELDDKFQELNTRMYIYVGFVVAIIAFIGFFLNFFGKKTIRSWVDEKINEIAKEQLDARLEPIYIKYKDERTKELEERWESRLKDIEEKWNDYEQSMKKAMAEIEKGKGPKSTTEIRYQKFRQFVEKLEQVKEEREYSAGDWLIKARFEQLKGNDKNAVEYYTKAINKNQTLAVAYNNRAVSHRDLKKFKEAFEDHYRAIELAPNYYRSFSSLATTQIIAGKYTDALNNVEKALTLDLDDEASAIVYYQKFIIMKLLGSDTAETEKAFGAALEKEFDLTYDFSSIGNWLSAVVLPVDMRKFIEEKTEMLKKKIK